MLLNKDYPVIFFCDKIVTISVLLFAISTAIAWSFYGNRSAAYLFGKSNQTLSMGLCFVCFYRIVELEAIWAFGDAAQV